MALQNDIAINSRESLSRFGFSVARRVLTAEEVNRYRISCAELTDDAAVHRRKDAYGVRDLFRIVPDVRGLVRAPALRHLVEECLDAPAFAVRGILFDKPPDANWRVPWHQDLTIAVAQKNECPGFGPWSHKAGIPHVQPPTEILQRMVTTRIHLDDCSSDNGALHVIPGSHRGGKLPQESVLEAVRRNMDECCELEAGNVLLMRPLIIHASWPATKPSHRRVVHIEWAAQELPAPLDWYERIC